MSAALALQQWLEARLDDAGAQWLRDAVASMAGGGTGHGMVVDNATNNDNIHAARTGIASPEFDC